MPAPDDDPAPLGLRLVTTADGRGDALVEEAPLVLSVHDQQLMTMRTTGRDEDLALGFLLGEGIVRSAEEIASLRTVAGDPAARRADAVHVELRRAPDARMRGRLARTHEIRSSCGICGIADPDALLDELPPLLPGVPRLDRSRVPQLLDLLRRHQPLFARTGGCHGALLATPDLEVLGHGEDVGRHNALDKAIGMAGRGGANFADAVAVLSGRAGYDLVIKCLRIRIAVIVSVSAPSSLAFDLARAAGATLLGFARGTEFRVHTDGARLQG